MNHDLLHGAHEEGFRFLNFGGGIIREDVWFKGSLATSTFHVLPERAGWEKRDEVKSEEATDALLIVWAIDRANGAVEITCSECPGDRFATPDDHGFSSGVVVAGAAA